MLDNNNNNNQNAANKQTNVKSVEQETEWQEAVTGLNKLGRKTHKNKHINHSTQSPDMNKRNQRTHQTTHIHALKCKAHKSILSHFPSERLNLNLK